MFACQCSCPVGLWSCPSPCPWPERRRWNNHSKIHTWTWTRSWTQTQNTNIDMDMDIDYIIHIFVCRSMFMFVFMLMFEFYRSFPNSQVLTKQKRQLETSMNLECLATLMVLTVSLHLFNSKPNIYMQFIPWGFCILNVLNYRIKSECVNHTISPLRPFVWKVLIYQCFHMQSYAHLQSQMTFTP